ENSDHGRSVVQLQIIDVHQLAVELNKLTDSRIRIQNAGRRSWWRIKTVSQSRALREHLAMGVIDGHSNQPLPVSKAVHDALKLFMRTLVQSGFNDLLQTL